MKIKIEVLVELLLIRLVIVHGLGRFFKLFDEGIILRFLEFLGLSFEASS
jgi:hypothetical protein